MPRHRSVRLAVLGNAVQRAATERYTSRTIPALRRRAVLATLLLLSLALITLYFRSPEDGPLASARSGAAAVLKPFQVAADRVVQPFQDVYGYFADLVNAKEENDKLEDENRRLRQENAQSQAALQEIETLRDLLGYVRGPSFPTDYRPVAAEVIAYPPSQFNQRVTIAAGTSQGVREGDPVVNEDGLVGKITDVTAEQAEVTLLTDESIAVSALDLDQNVTGLVRQGRAGGGSLVLDLVEKRYVVEQGDEIATAGSQRGDIESIYPRGIAIGTVTFVSDSDTETYKRIQLEPAVDFGSLDGVVVLIPKVEGR